MAHSIYSQKQEETIEKFDSFDKVQIKMSIVKYLSDNPTGTVEHYNGEQIINFYEQHNGKPCKVITKGNKDFYKPLN